MPQEMKHFEIWLKIMRHIQFKSCTLTTWHEQTTFSMILWSYVTMNEHNNINFTIKIGNWLLFVFLQIWWFILKIRNNALSTFAINTYDYHGNNLFKSKNKEIIIPIIWIQEFFNFLAFTDTWDYHLVCVIKLHKVIFFQNEKSFLGQGTFASPKIVGCYGCMESFRDFLRMCGCVTQP